MVIGIFRSKWFKGLLFGYTIFIAYLLYRLPFQHRLGPLSISITHLKSPLALLLFLLLLHRMGDLSVVRLKQAAKRLLGILRIKQATGEQKDNLDIFSLSSLFIALLSSIFCIITFMLDYFGSPHLSRLYLTCLMSFLVLLLILRMLRLISFPSIFISLYDIIIFLIIILLVFGYLLMPGYFTPYPINRSSDLVHHYALVDYIAKNGKLVSSYQPHLGEMNHYSWGAHVITAILSRSLGISSFLALSIVFFLSIYLSCMAGFALCRSILPKSPLVDISGLLGIFALLESPFIMSLSFHSFYFSMILCILLLLCIVICLIKLDKSGNIGFWIICISILTLGTTFIYPHWLLIGAVSIFVVILSLKKVKLAGRITCLMIILAPLFFSIKTHLASRAAIAKGILSHEGAIIAFNWKNMDEHWFIVPFFIGVLLLGYSKKRGCWWVLLPIFTTMAISLSIFACHRWFGLFSVYVATKFIFMILFLGIVSIAVFFFSLLDFIFGETSKPVHGFDIAKALITIIAIILSINWLVRWDYRRAPVIDDDLIAVAEWASLNLDSDLVDIVLPYPIQEYIIRVAIFESARSQETDSILLSTPSTLDEWLSSEAKPYAIAGSACLSSSHRCTILFASGDYLILGARGAGGRI